MTYLEFYKLAIATKRMGHPGLCSAKRANNWKSKEFEIIMPTRENLRDLQDMGLDLGYWGGDSRFGGVWRFTHLRQNLVLLLAAMAGQLDKPKKK